MDDSTIQRMIKIGTVSALDSTNLKARVLFFDTGMTSDWLAVLQRKDEVVSVTINTAAEHTHTATAKVVSWMPQIGDMVVVVYPPIFNSDGFIVGQL